LHFFDPPPPPPHTHTHTNCCLSGCFICAKGALTHMALLISLFFFSSRFYFSCVVVISCSHRWTFSLKAQPCGCTRRFTTQTTTLCMGTGGQTLACERQQSAGCAALTKVLSTFKFKSILQFITFSPICGSCTRI
jgi:hypothetical protein